MNGVKKQSRSKGSGHIFKRGKTYYLQYDINGKRKKVSLKCNHLKDKIIEGKVIKGAETCADEILAPAVQAKTKEQVLLHVAENRKLIKRTKVLLDDAWEWYLRSSSRPDSSPKTLDGYRYMFKNLCDWIREKHPIVTHLSQVTDDIANEYAQYLWNREVLVNCADSASGKEKRKISAKTFNDHIKALSLVTRVLSNDAGVDRNPWKSIQKKQQNKQTRKEFTEDEVKKILQAFDDPNLKLLNQNEMKVMFHFGAWTGLRLIDCALMTWGNINLERNVISCTPVKTKRVQRVVVIPIHPSLESQLEIAINWKQDDYVLPKVAERYKRNPSGVQKDVIKVFTHIGLETSAKINDPHRARRANVYGFHSFRHSFVSFCAKAGVPLPVVQSIVGHGNPAITRHYVHIGEESVRKAVDALPMATATVGKKPSDSDRLERIGKLLDGEDNLSDREQRILKIIRE